MEWTKDYIKNTIKNLLYTSIVLVGISLILPLLKNPSTTEATNQDRFIYVTSQMRYYDVIESLLLPKYMKSDLRANLIECLVDLYKLIINFQVQTILQFYYSRTKNFFRGTINYNYQDKKLQDIKDNDKELILKVEIVISTTSLNKLKNLTKEVEALYTALYSLLKK